MAKSVKWLFIAGGGQCRLKCWFHMKIRGMAGKFVDTSAIRKSNTLLKKRFA